MGEGNLDSIYIVMPAYNEEGGIKEVIQSWYQALEGKDAESRIVIADYGSTDKTHEIIEELINNGYSQLEVLVVDNQFHGPKVIALYKYAIEKGADYVFHTDSDGQTDPRDFEGFWNQRDQYDGIFGMRTARGDGFYRKMVERVVGILLRLYFGVKIPDANAPFRLMRTSVLEKYINNLPTDYAIPNIMVTTFFSYYNENICFKEICFGARKNGRSSIDIRKIIKMGCDALKDFSSFKKQMIR